MVEAIGKLKAAGVENAVGDARLLLAYALQASKEALIAEPGRVLNARELHNFNIALFRRESREPMSHILGKREFYGIEFDISPDVLDPRPDSETLIEAVLLQMPDKNEFIRILDLGSGSGCLVLSLLTQYPKAYGVGVDASLKALKQFRKNIDKLGLGERAQGVRSNWLADLPQTWLQSFDVIVSNPPYIPSHDIASLEPEVKDYEPLLALDGGEDGFDCYKDILAEAHLYLKPEGLLVFECGIGQAENLKEMMEAMGYENIFIRKDLAGIERVVGGRFGGL